MFYIILHVKNLSKYLANFDLEIDLIQVKRKKKQTYAFISSLKEKVELLFRK